MSSCLSFFHYFVIVFVFLYVVIDFVSSPVIYLVRQFVRSCFLYICRSPVRYFFMPSVIGSFIIYVVRVLVVCYRSFVRSVSLSFVRGSFLL